MKKLSVLLLILIFYFYSNGQTAKPYWSVGVNPLGLLEPMSLIGSSVSYRFSPKIELWSEASYIFSNVYIFPDWKQVRGYRFILQPRFYPNRNHLFFVAAEFRLKHFIYKTYDNFINSSRTDTLTNFHYNASQVLPGGAVLIGGTVRLDRKDRLSLEMTFGLGSKVRKVKMKNIPEGFERLYEQRKYILNIEYDRNNADLFYMPIGFRLKWKLSH